MNFGYVWFYCTMSDILGIRKSGLIAPFQIVQNATEAVWFCKDQYWDRLRAGLSWNGKTTRRMSLEETAVRYNGLGRIGIPFSKDDLRWIRWVDFKNNTQYIDRPSSLSLEQEAKSLGFRLKDHLAGRWDPIRINHPGIVFDYWSGKKWQRTDPDFSDIPDIPDVPDVPLVDEH